MGYNLVSNELIKKDIKKYVGKTIVIKYGGSIMKDEECKLAFLEDVASLKNIGVNVIIVHGGGPNISDFLKKVNIESKFKNGLRVTDKDTMEIVEMILSGQVNKELSGILSSLKINAIGISGRDGNLISVKKKIICNNSEAIDIGYVGEVKSINISFLQGLLEIGCVPIISPVGFDDKGEVYNINADYAASAISSAINAEKLILMTDVEGVYLDINDKNSIIQSITIDEIKEYISEGIIKGGMIPKMECCIEAISNGTKEVNLIYGRRKHSLITHMFYEENNSTTLKGGETEWQKAI
ncbi:acetylglutamate kinase [Oceanirhabdus sp. W0125-5]|uniref:acetylglutamate kinase n=1 Tax=Oceanirhabdus sp. W0125-5 TaxID=2999116 RepID=UPI003FA5F352